MIDMHLFTFSKSYCIPGHRLCLICESPNVAPALYRPARAGSASRSAQVVLGLLVPDKRVPDLEPCSGPERAGQRTRPRTRSG